MRSQREAESKGLVKEREVERLRERERGAGEQIPLIFDQSATNTDEMRTAGRDVVTSSVAGHHDSPFTLRKRVLVE